MPKVSVIVPNYNHANFLRQRLDSIFNQTYQDFEVILLDDCSTDSSVEILKEYSKHTKVAHFVINDKNSGSTFKQWKKGIDLSTGEFIWIAESDDYCEKNFLEALVYQLEANPNVYICASNLIHIDASNHCLIDRTYYKSKLFDDFSRISSLFILGNYLRNASALLIRRQGFSFVSWPEIITMRFCGDWLLYVMILQNGYLITHEEYLSYFRTHPLTVSKSDNANYLKYSEGLNIVAFIDQHYSLKLLKRLLSATKWYGYLKNEGFDDNLRKEIETKIQSVFSISKSLILITYYLNKPVEYFYYRIYKRILNILTNL